MISLNSPPPNTVRRFNSHYVAAPAHPVSGEAKGNFQRLEASDSSAFLKRATATTTHFLDHRPSPLASRKITSL